MQQDWNSLRGYHILEYKGKGTLFQNFLVERSEKKYILKVFNKSENEETESKVEWILDKCQKNDGIYNDQLQQIIDVFHNMQHKYLVVEYFEEGNILEYFLNKNIEHLDLELSIQVLSDILRGVSRLHEKRQCHMNLRLENIYFRQQWKHAAVCDYRIQYIDQVINYFFANEYLPPEMIGKGKIDLKSEIWTLGVIFFLLLFGRFPFTDLEQIQAHTLTNKFNLRKLLKEKQIYDLDQPENANEKDKEHVKQIIKYYAILNNFFSKIFEYVQLNRMSYLQLCSDQIFQIEKGQNLQHEKEIYEKLDTTVIKVNHNKNTIDVGKEEEEGENCIDESVEDKKFIYDMELEGAKKGIQFKNLNHSNHQNPHPDPSSFLHSYMNQIPKNKSTIITNGSSGQQPQQQPQQVSLTSMGDSLMESSMLVSFYDRSKFIKDRQQAINQLQYCYSVHFSRHEFLLHSLNKILESSAFKYKQKIILKYFIIKCALHFGQDSLQTEDTNLFYSDIWSIWKVSDYKKNQKQYLSNFEAKLKVDLLQSYLQIQGWKESQLQKKDQEEIVLTLTGKEDFKTEIKGAFRKVLSSFAATIDRIIQEKKNLPEETVSELKRNQLRAIICCSANHCFQYERLNDIFPNYMKEHKAYTLPSFCEWIENMSIPELSEEIIQIPKHFYKNK